MKGKSHVEESSTDAKNESNDILDIHVKEVIDKILEKNGF